MDAAFGAAIVARRPAALEAPVDDMAVAAGGTDGGDRGFEVARAGRSAVCADVEFRQVAVEPSRDLAAVPMCLVVVYSAVPPPPALLLLPPLPLFLFFPRPFFFMPPF